MGSVRDHVKLSVDTRRVSETSYRELVALSSNLGALTERLDISSLSLGKVFEVRAIYEALMVQYVPNLNFSDLQLEALMSALSRMTAASGNPLLRDQSRRVSRPSRSPATPGRRSASWKGSPTV